MRSKKNNVNDMQTILQDRLGEALEYSIVQQDHGSSTEFHVPSPASLDIISIIIVIYVSSPVVVVDKLTWHTHAPATYAHAFAQNVYVLKWYLYDVNCKHTIYNCFIEHRTMINVTHRQSTYTHSYSVHHITHTRHIIIIITSTMIDINISLSLSVSLHTHWILINVHSK